MQIRLVDPPDDAAVVDVHSVRDACRWCGFWSAGTRAVRYREEDGSTAFACPVCFAARHAAALDCERFRLVWAPELTQAELGLLARVVAVVRVSAGAPSRLASMKVRDHAPERCARRLFRDLQGRGTVLEAAFRDAFGAPVAELWESLGDDVRTQMVRGLRVLPIAFEADEIAAWTGEEGTLHGYTAEVLETNDWFLDDIRPVPSGLGFGFVDDEKGTDHG